MRKNPARLWDLPSALLLLLVLMTVSQRLYATDWAPGLSLALIFCSLGAALGLALGISKFKTAGATWIGIGYSLVLLPMVTAGVMYADIPWLERLTSLGGRLANSLAQFISRQQVPDTLLFVVFTSLGFWIISLIAGYALTRRGDFLSAVIPAGIVLLIIQVYDAQVGDRAIILAVFACLCLLLLGRLSIVRRRQSWKEMRLTYSAESWLDLNIAFLATAVVLVVLAWILPASNRPVLAAKLAWEDITEPFERIRENLGNAVAGVKGYAPVTAVEFYGDRLSLGQNASSGEGVSLRVTVPRTRAADRYYWRVRAYDQFVDNQWQSVFSYEQPFLPEQPSLDLADTPLRAAEFTFSTPRSSLAVLVTPARPVWVSRPSLLSFSPASENEIDPLLFRADPPILVGEQYSVLASNVNPTVLELQNAGHLYPAWVQDNYLQLPADLSLQVRDLASRITREAESPYDKAAAVTEYLRANIRYSLSVELAPEGVNPLNWFLFSTRSGFCNYYATAEVILLRAAGVPARMVVGFAEGEFEPPDKYIIREKDAHAWPEVYFPGVGWVEFEPTTGQPDLLRQPGEEIQAPFTPNLPLDDGAAAGGDSPAASDAEASGNDDNGSRFNSLFRLSIFFLVIILLIVGSFVAYTSGWLEKLFRRTQQITRTPVPVLLATGLGWFSASPPPWLKRWVNLSRQSPIERTFNSVYHSLKALGSRSLPSRTPAEAAGELVYQLPGIAAEVNVLLKEYQAAIFGRGHFELEKARQAEARLRRHTRNIILQRKLQQFKKTIFHPFNRK